MASGRDQGGGYRYFLACAYAVPVGYAPLEPEATTREEDTSRSDVGKPEAVEIPLSVPELSELECEADGEALRAVTHRVRGKRPEEGEDGPEGFSSERRLLCVGVPLRTKAGREVLGQVQALINRLEAHGLPVQRFHSDRAKELRSSALVGWLRSQGVHTSWNPGESPAGNSAEVSVQHLKSGVRRLLLTSRVGRACWPLALLHISTRNWLRFFESLGMPQAPLLAFRTRVEARKRTRTGYQHQWVSRTIGGLYIGQAPHTTGGHLVLIIDAGKQKVLLTGTVFPVRGDSFAGPLKPRFRLKEKRSSFATRVVAAAVVAHIDDDGLLSRLTPGGESSGLETRRS